MSTDTELLLVAVGTGSLGFVLRIIWGKIAQPDTFDRDAILFFVKMWSGVVVMFMALYWVLKYKLL